MPGFPFWSHRGDVLACGLFLALGTGAMPAHAVAILTASASVSPGDGTFGRGSITYSTASGSNGGSFVNTSSPDTTAQFSSTTAPGQNSSFARYQVSQTAAGGRSASAFAGANLAQGIVRLSANTATFPGIGGGQGFAQASIFDQLTFNIAGATSSTVTLIGVEFALTGSLGTNSGIAAIDLPGFDFEGLVNGNTDGNVVYASDTQNGITRESASSAWVSADFTGTTTQELIFHGVYQLVGASEVVDVSFNPIASVSGGTSISDYSETGQLSLTLPRTVTFTSPDGFLSAPNSVPEPGSLALLGLGLVGLRFGMRKQYGPSRSG